MKTLVTYYSRSGNTRKVAEEIAQILNADIDEIFDNKKRNGIIGWLGGGRDAMKKVATTIRYAKDPKEYDLVIVGTPIWVGTATPAVKTYLTKNQISKIAFFCTCGDKQTSAWLDMTELSSKPVTTLELKDRIVKENGAIFEEKIEDFCDKLK